jgi:hypothetical protein
VVSTKLSTALITLAALAAVRPVAAQQRRPVWPLERVRVTAPSAGLHGAIATVVSRSAHDITLRLGDPRRSPRRADDPADVTVPLDSVRSMEVSLGVGKSQAGIGATIGIVFGLVVGYAIGKSQPPEWFFDPTSVYAVEGALIGGGAGALIGSRIRPEHWRPMALRYHHIAVAPLPGGRVGVGAALAF